MLTVGDTQTLNATATYGDGSTRDVSVKAGWNTSDGTVAEVGLGVISAKSPGTATITAAYEGLTATTTVTVTAARLTSLQVSPDSPVLAIGASTAFTATGTFSDGASLDLTTAVTWTSSDSSVASVSATGLVFALAPGTTMVTATQGTVTGSTSVTVTWADTVSLAIVPTEATLFVGRDLQLKAMETLSDQSIIDRTASVTWASSNAQVASITMGGLVHAVAAGTTTVYAIVGGITAAAFITVEATHYDELTLSPAEVTIAQGQDQAFTALASTTNGQPGDVSNQVIWESSNSSVATVSDLGVVHAVGQGIATITATAGPLVTSATVTVTPPALVSLRVTSTSSEAVVGGQLQLTATGTYSDGSTQDVTSMVTWSSATPATGTVGSDGIFTARAAGTVQITATSGDVSASTSVTVHALDVATLRVTPSPASVALGLPLQFTATVTRTSGGTQDVTQVAQWTTSAPIVATVSSTGLAQSLTRGTATITATLNGVSGAATLSVTDAVLSSLEVTYTGTAFVAEQLQLKALARYTDGHSVDVTSEAAWSTGNTQVATISGTGLLNGVSQGSVNVQATFGGQTATVTIPIRPVVLSSIQIAPCPLVLPLGDSGQLSSTGTYTDQSTQTLTAIWSASPSSVANVDASGRVSTAARGSTVISATKDGVTGTCNVTVGPPVARTLRVVPADQTIAQGRSLQLIVTGVFSDNSQSNFTTLATYSSSDLSIATVSPSGLIQTVSPGTVQIMVTYAGVTTTVTETVSPPVLEFLSVTASSSTVVLGETLPLSVEGIDSAGNTFDASDLVTWQVRDPLVAGITADGILVPVSEGEVVVWATSGAVLGTLTVQVLPAALRSITISPDPISVPLGASVTVSAAGHYSDGTDAPLIAGLAWLVDDSSLARVTGGTTLTALGQGTTTLTAVSGNVMATVTVDVTEPVIASIALTPVDQQLPLGTTLQLTLNATYTDGHVEDVTSQATLTSSNQAIATVSSDGLVRSRGKGVFSIHAQLNALEATAAERVVDPVLVAFEVPDSASLALGRSWQLWAVAHDSTGAIITETNSATWTSSDPTLATVTSGGLVQTRGVGTVTITATMGTWAASLQITITAAVLDHITVSPNTVSVRLTESTTITAAGVKTDGTPADITGQVTWSSSRASVATVSNGVVTTVSEGNATITAAVGTLRASAAVQVLAPPIASITLTPEQPTVALGNTLQLTATVTDVLGRTQDVTQYATWTSSNAAIAIVSRGIVTSLSEGATAITVEYGDVSTTTTLDVTAAQPVTATLTAPLAEIAAGLTETLDFAVKYTDGHIEHPTTFATWTSSSPSVATVDAGVLFALHTGAVTITATTGAASASVVVYVLAPAPVSLQITNGNQTRPLGTGAQLQAIATFTDGSVRDVTGSAYWTSSNGAIVNVTDAGWVQTVGLGSATIRAYLDQVASNTVTVTVTAAELESLAIDGAYALPAGRTEQLFLTGTYTDGHQANLASTAVWTVSDSTLLSVSTSGLLTAKLPGTASVTAAVGSVSVAVSVTVLPAVLTSLSVSPSSRTCAKGLTATFTATGTFSDGGQKDITSTSSWVSDDPTVASVLSPGVFKCVGRGTTFMRVTRDDVVASYVFLTVTDPAVVSLSLSPDSPSLPVGLYQQLQLVVTYTDGTTRDATDQATWTTVPSMTSILTVYSGFVTGQAEGTVGVKATLIGGVSVTTNVTVTAAIPTSLLLTPADQNIALGLQQQFTAQAFMSDSTMKNVTTSVTWTTGNPSVATISSAGKLTATGRGTTTVKATINGVSAQTNVTVGPSVPSVLTVTPSSATLPLGTTMQIFAKVTMSDGTQTDVTTSAAWSSAEPDYATVTDDTTMLDGSTSSGLIMTAFYTNVTTSIVATYQGLQASVSVRVTDAALTWIELSPVNPSITLPNDRQFTAVGHYSDGTSRDLTNQVVWSSGNISVANVTNNSPPSFNSACTQLYGCVQSAGHGSANICATSGTISVCTAVTVP